MIKAELVNQTMTWHRALHAHTNRNSRHVPLRAAKRLPVIFQRDRNIDGSRGMRILVIEDEFKAGVYLKSGLEESGCRVDIAMDGANGLFLAQKENYDVIVINVMLPGMDGWTVLKALRVTNSTPVLFLTARAPGHSELPAKLFLDLVEANRRQLLDAGVMAKNIEAVGPCTACHTELLFSYRAEKGVTGRMMAAAGISPE